MKRARLWALFLIPLLAGCDIAVVAVLATRKSGSSSKSPAAPPAPNLSYFVWVANLAAGEDATEAAAIGGAGGGNPGAAWTQLASAQASCELTMPAGTFNSVLIQVTQVQFYQLDAIEVLDATGTTVGTASTVFSDLAATPTEATGTPDGVTSLLAGNATNKAFLLTRNASAFTKFRINIWKPAARGEGDVEWTATYALAGDQLAGGADVNSVGMTYLTFRDVNSVLLLRYSASGTVVQDDDGPPKDLSTIANPVSAGVGSSSVAIDRTSDDVFIASTISTGNIQLQKWTGISHSASWGIIPVSQPGVDRVESNGLAVRPGGDIVLAAGADYGGLNGVGHYLRSFKQDNSDRWGTSTLPAVPLDTNGAPTYWYAVTTFGTNDIFTTGNLSATLGAGAVDIYSSRVVDNSQTSSTVTETWNERVPSASSAMAIGRSIGVDGSGNAYVAGYYTHTDLDSVILKYTNGAPPASFHVDLRRAGNDEYLDIVVEADGTIYAVGYETNTDQDLVLVKIRPNNSIAWKRTLDRGVGDDRGVSVCVTATRVIVVGEVTVAAGNKDIHVRSYIK